MTGDKTLTLGSLFSGSGGFELAGILAGITPVFNSEIEPFAIRVTTARLPQVRHYGDVSGLHGGSLEPVDILTWGSPCQGLSLAGKRKGLADERSGLYVEAVRIVREMLEATNREYPKFCVFENVPGLLSSNGGEDFLTCMDMMQELGFLPDINILDAQFMGVPQRRKRVYITWVNVDYILRKRTSISDSIILQLLTEILQINLAGVLKAYGVVPKKSAVLGLNLAEGGLKKRMKLFSLQEESRLRMLRQSLEEIQVTCSNVPKGSDGIPGNGRTEGLMSTAGDTPSGNLSARNQSMNIVQLWNQSLDDGLQIENGSITSTWSKETMIQKICFYFQGLVNTVSVTTVLMQSLGTQKKFLNCFEWVNYTLTELKEFINETEKYQRGAQKVGWYDTLRADKQRISELAEQVEQHFAGGCSEKLLSEFPCMPWNLTESFRTGKGTAGNPANCPGAADGKDGRGNAGGTLILCDQGGERMDVTEDVTCTLRAEAHHPPCVVEAAGFCTEHSAQSRGIGYEEEASPTLRAGVVPAALAIENHPADSRVKISGDEKVQTLTSRMGTGGGNVPLVIAPGGPLEPVTLKIRAGCPGGGKGAQMACNLSSTLGCNNDQTVFIPYGICSKKSNAMLSDNPKSGFYEAQTSRTLDCNGGNPSAAQGGIAIVAFAQNQRDEVRDLGDKSGALAAEPGMKQQTYVLQGSMIGREDKNGPQGSGINEDVSFTLDAADRHAVAYCMTTGEYSQVIKEKAPTLMARDYKDPPVVNDKPEPEPYYIVRRLTPTECARLQGFPDWWCEGLGIEEPASEELSFWTDVFETHRRLVTHASKPKTEKQILKWLKNPYSDSAAYKLWGNGVALPCVYFVLSGIVWVARVLEEPQKE